MDRLGGRRYGLHRLGVRDHLFRCLADLYKQLEPMKASVLALLLLANQSASTACLCEQQGEVMAYQMIGDDSACEIQLYPPNHPPKTIWRGGRCLDLMRDRRALRGLVTM